MGNDPADYHGNRAKLDWQGNLTLAPGEVATLGAEHQEDWINVSAPVSASISNDAGFAQLQSSFAGRFFNTVSVRYDDNSQFGSKATYRLAPAYLIQGTGTKLKATVGTGFNPPSLVELYENYPQFDFYANPDLRPEKSLGYDAGFEQRAGKPVRFGATWFHNAIDNLIELNATGTSWQNIGRATTEGIESFVTWTPVEALALRADYTYTIAEDDILHQELIERPRNKATLDATWHATERASLDVTLLYVGPWVDINRAGTATGVPVNGYTVVNLAGTYDAGHGVTLFTRIDNLLDRHYQNPLGFEHPGFGIYGGVRVALTP